MLSDSDPDLERSIAIGSIVGGGSVVPSRRRTLKEC